jgi:hypothetical protein
MAVFVVEGQGALSEIPSERGEPPLGRGDRAWPDARALGTGRKRREVQPDAFGVGERLKVEDLAGAPAPVVTPVDGVGAARVPGRRRAGIGPGGLDQRLES